MDVVIKFLGKVLIWLPLLAAGAEILGAIYIWLVQYELNVTVGQINGATSDISRTQLWPSLLIALAVADAFVCFWLYWRQKSAKGLSMKIEIMVVAATFAVPMVIFGAAAIWQMSAAMGGLQQGFQSAQP